MGRRKPPALQVLHCEPHLLALCKPAGVPVVPDDSGDTSLLDQGQEWVKAQFAKPGRVFLGVVHRLDRPVSGVVLFARTSKAAARLSDQFRGGAAEKLYLGLLERAPAALPPVVEQWLEKDERTNRVREVPAGTAGARRAVTRVRLLQGAAPGKHAWVALWPETGRPHQLRVAMASLGAPLLGDLKYGAAAALPDGSIGLHARRLAVRHPTRGERLTFTCDLPPRAWWSDPPPALAEP